MTETVVSLTSISKCYRLSARPSVTNISERARTLFRQPAHEGELWALRDVSLEIDAGETVAVIGANGAGKSTLLKILSGITSPTAGTGVVRGRLSSLIEVGTGFHGDLSGRDNVYMNGALLGMRRAEIARDFDAIVEFAGVERFIDVPVKRYSSGMYVRLAFAVAAHVDPDILIVDEALSVGDQAFQEKCLRRMETFASGGRTVVFVSHNLAAVSRLCARGIVLDHGSVTYDGPIAPAANAYRRLWAPVAAGKPLDTRRREGSGAARVQTVSVTDRAGGNELHPGQPLVVRAEIAWLEPQDGAQLEVEFGIEDASGARLTTLSPAFDPTSTLRSAMLEGRTTIECEIDGLPLSPDTYFLTVLIARLGEALDYVPRGVELRLQTSDYFGSGILPKASQGPVLVDQRWRLADSPSRVVAG